MLKRNNDIDLLKKGIHEDAIPFCQIWQELVYEKTLDTYQYRILTALSALEELEIVIDKTLKGLFTSDANINTCREEILHLINEDIVFNKYYSSISNRLKHCLGNAKPKEVADKNRLLAHIKYARKEIQPDYERKTLIELKDSILKRDIKRIVILSNIVASQAAHNGWSSHALSELLRFFYDEKSFDEQWCIFESALLNRSKQSFDVLMLIPFRNHENSEGKNTLEVLTELGLEIKPYDYLVYEYNDLEDIGELLNANKKYFRIRVEAFDVFSAAHSSIRKISDLLNVASFYNLVSAWNLSAVTIVVINCENRYHKQLKPGQLYKTYDYLEGSGKVFANTKAIFANDNQRELREKMTGSFGYANISRASLFQEEKYMNLWVALESLARTKMYPDIISNIIQTVPAAMSLKYIYRIVRNYVEDCSRCGVEFKFSSCVINMKQDTKQQLVRETIEIFKSPSLYDELLDKCSVNTLLKHRTEGIHELLTDISKLTERVKAHYNRVRWQIQRLYRVRNEIAHAALQNETSLVKYIEHLYDYLATYIAEIVSCVSDGQDRSFEESIAIIRDNYDVFISLFEQGDVELLENTVQKTGIIDLVSRNRLCSW